MLAYVVRSSISFPSPITDGLTAWGTFLMVTVRIAAPVLLALAFLAIRARIQR
jgi:ABC-type maltose transport system permease subunit